LFLDYCLLFCFTRFPVYDYGVNVQVSGCL
jgi:hypothetical protein